MDAETIGLIFLGIVTIAVMVSTWNYRAQPRRRHSMTRRVRR
jgi:cbb3-type cytochrome oxidase subunit 3